MKDKLISLIRTFVPILVGTLSAWLVSKGIQLPAEAYGGLESFLIEVLSVLTATAYYAIVRWLESKWPKLGWLLGYAAAPEYKAGK